MSIKIKNTSNKNLKTIFNFLEKTSIKVEYSPGVIIGDTFTIVKKESFFEFTSEIKRNPVVKLITSFIKEADCKKAVMDVLKAKFDNLELFDNSGKVITNRKQLVAIGLSMGERKCSKK